MTITLSQSDNTSCPFVLLLFTAASGFTCVCSKSPGFEKGEGVMISNFLEKRELLLCHGGALAGGIGPSFATVRGVRNCVWLLPPCDGVGSGGENPSALDGNNASRME